VLKYTYIFTEKMKQYYIKCLTGITTLEFMFDKVKYFIEKAANTSSHDKIHESSKCNLHNLMTYNTMYNTYQI
jgi:hypothetical protein